MEKRFCGIDLGSILEGMRPLDEDRALATYALEEALTGALPYHPLRDDGEPASIWCLLILGRLGADIRFVSLDGPKRFGVETRDMPIARVREAVAMIPDGRAGRDQMRRVLASPHAAAGILMIAEGATGRTNCAFAWNPALARDDAARLLKAYFTETIRSWTARN